MGFFVALGLTSTSVAVAVLDIARLIVSHSSKNCRLVPIFVHISVFIIIIREGKKIGQITFTFAPIPKMNYDSPGTHTREICLLHTKVYPSLSQESRERLQITVFCLSFLANFSVLGCYSDLLQENT